MKNSAGFYIFLCVTVSFLTQRILASIKVTAISDSIFIIILMTISVVYTVLVNTRNSFGRKLNIISSIIMLMMGFCISISSILIDVFPRFSDQHVILVSIVVAIGGIGFFAMIVFIIWASKKFSNRKG